jgi:hypothetical protein
VERHLGGLGGRGNQDAESNHHDGRFRRPGGHIAQSRKILDAVRRASYECPDEQAERADLGDDQGAQPAGGRLASISVKGDQCERTQPDEFPSC